MRPFELALVVSLLSLSGLTYAFNKNTLPRWLYLAPALIAAVHAIPLVEGARWQMIPAYIAAVLFLVLAMQPAAFFRRGLVMLLLIPTVLSVIFAFILPVSGYPAPTGDYKVGTVTLNLVDNNRTMTYGDTPDAPREFTIQIWYPLDSSIGGRTAPVIQDADKYPASFANEFGVPAFVMSHVGLLRSYSIPRGATESLLISDEADTYPVVVGSHGWRGFRALHTTQFEELASHGYIAVGIDHTYGALATVLGDGSARYLDPAALPDGLPDDIYNANGLRVQDLFEGDIKYVLDELERLNESSFSGKMDLSRIGMFGHSTGGGAMVQTCQTDTRCVAVLGMDAWVEPIPAAQRAQGLTQPSLFMRSEPWTGDDNDQLLNEIYDASTGEKQRFTIRGTLHRDYTLQGILSPLLQLIRFTGTLDPVRTLDIVDAYTLTFFDHTLKGEPAPLLEGASAEYPEVTFN